MDILKTLTATGYVAWAVNCYRRYHRFFLLFLLLLQLSLCICELEDLGYWWCDEDFETRDHTLDSVLQCIYYSSLLVDRDHCLCSLAKSTRVSMSTLIYISINKCTKHTMTNFSTYKQQEDTSFMLIYSSWTRSFISWSRRYILSPALSR